MGLILKLHRPGVFKGWAGKCRPLVIVLMRSAYLRFLLGKPGCRNDMGNWENAPTTPSLPQTPSPTRMKRVKNKVRVYGRVCMFLVVAYVNFSNTTLSLLEDVTRTKKVYSLFCQKTLEPLKNTHLNRKTSFDWCRSDQS